MKAWLILFSGILKLTAKEIDVLAAFINAKLRLEAAGIKMNVFTPEVKKIVAKQLSMNNFNSLNVYIKSLKDKGVIYKGKESGLYLIHPVALWQEDKITIVFR